MIFLLSQLVKTRPHVKFLTCSFLTFTHILIYNPQVWVCLSQHLLILLHLFRPISLYKSLSKIQITNSHLKFTLNSSNINGHKSPQQS